MSSLTRSLVAAAVAISAACSANTSGNGDGLGGSSGNGGSLGSGGSAAAGGSSSGGSGGTLNLGGSSAGGSAGDAGNGGSGTVIDGCAAQQNKAQGLPLDVYVMFDQSASMTADAGGVTRWNAVKKAMIDFVSDSASDGIGIGIQYFGIGIPLIGQSCNANYANPDQPIAPLPGNAQNIINSLNSHNPTSDTPTNKALAGAITYAKQWKNQHMDHVVVVLLVTDGVPDGCGATVVGPAPTGVTGVAANGAGSQPQIPTFVIGVGPALTSLNQIAAAGGSQQAYLVSGGTNVSGAVLDALNKIRGTAQLPCVYQIPPETGGTAADPNKVNVSYTPPGGQPQTILAVPDAAHCDPNTGGWYYDQPIPNQTKIEICPTTCGNITQSNGGSLDVLLGCAVQGVH